eukprot:4331697-Prymnesium_polylepis.1
MRLPPRQEIWMRPPLSERPQPSGCPVLAQTPRAQQQAPRRVARNNQRRQEPEWAQTAGTPTPGRDAAGSARRRYRGHSAYRDRATL